MRKEYHLQQEFMTGKETMSNRPFDTLNIDRELLASCVQFLEKLKIEMKLRFDGVNQTFKQVGHLWNNFLR